MKSRFMKRAVGVEKATINRALQRLYCKTTDKVDRPMWIQDSSTRRDMPIYRPTSFHARLDLSRHSRHAIAENKSDIYSYQKHPTVQVLNMLVNKRCKTTPVATFHCRSSCNIVYIWLKMKTITYIKGARAHNFELDNTI